MNSKYVCHRLDFRGIPHNEPQDPQNLFVGYHACSASATVCESDEKERLGHLNATGSIVTTDVHNNKRFFFHIFLFKAHLKLFLFKQNFNVLFNFCHSTKR